MICYSWYPLTGNNQESCTFLINNKLRLNTDRLYPW
jgi:hypothetical protein